jgi:hypothetical protein
MLLYKAEGRTSGIHEAQVNGVLCDVSLESQLVTNPRFFVSKEWIVITESSVLGPRSQPGDSGSLFVVEESPRKWAVAAQMLVGCAASAPAGPASDHRD